MDVRKAPPHPALSSFVSDYRSRSGDVDNPFRTVLEARAQVFFEFYFTKPHLFEIQRTGAREAAPWSVAVGVQTFRRVDLILSGRIEVFTIAFTSIGLHALFDLPMHLLTDKGVDADQLLGARGARDLHDRLAVVPTFATRTRNAAKRAVDRPSCRGAS